MSCRHLLFRRAQHRLEYADIGLALDKRAEKTGVPVRLYAIKARGIVEFFQPDERHADMPAFAGFHPSDRVDRPFGREGNALIRGALVDVRFVSLDHHNFLPNREIAFHDQFPF